MLKNDTSQTSRQRQNFLLALLCSFTVAVVIATILTVGSSGMHKPTTDRLSVNDPRPVALAAEMLEKKYGWVVTYEDPAYHESELVDVTESVSRNLDKFKPGQAPRVFIPKGGELAFEYNIDPATKRPDDSAVVIQQLLDTYAMAGNPGVFRLDRDGQRLHIVPVAAKQQNGALTPYKSVFDTLITIPVQKRNGIELLEAFCAAVSQASGTRVLIGMVPNNPFLRYQTEAGAKDKKARDFLVSELDRVTTHAKLSWQMFYNAKSKTYYLNIHGV